MRDPLHLPIPLPPFHSWYYWSLLTGCLRIVTHCHNTVAKHWISLSLCYRTDLKCCASDSLNKCYICIFVKKRTSVNFNFERKCCGIDQMFSKDVTNVPTRSQSILSQLGKICRELTVENVHVVNHGVRDTCFIKWDGTSVNVEAFGSWGRGGGPGACSPEKFWNLGPLNGWKCIRNFANHMFFVSKSMTLPWLSKI